MPVALLQAGLPSSNLTFLFAAFAVTSVVFFAYVFFVNRRQHEKQREIEELRRLLEHQEPGGED